MESAVALVVARLGQRPTAAWRKQEIAGYYSDRRPECQSVATDQLLEPRSRGQADQNNPYLVP